MKYTPQSLERRVVRTAVDWSCCGQTLIAFLVSRFPYRDKEGWQKAIAGGEITLNGKNIPPETVLSLHDQVEYLPKELPEPPADMDFKIVYEDEHLLVIDKPGNLCVHPAGPFFKHTLWHALCSRFGEIHFVNRLDRETSGLMIAAKDRETASGFAKRELLREKSYTVMVYGEFGEEKKHARGFLAKDPNSPVRKKRHFYLTEPSVPSETAETFLELLESSGRHSLLKATLVTGRMHQIRATLCSLGYPVVGDKLYGPDENIYLKQKTESITPEEKRLLILSRQALHASKLVFEHPFTGKVLSFESPAPFSLPRTEIAVTGAEGFIGSFMVRELKKRDISFIRIPREAFEDEKQLASLLSGVKKVLHFAGISRHADGEYLYQTNMRLAQLLAKHVDQETVIYLASSPHVLTKDLPYHKSKQDAMTLFENAGVRASALLMPNTFGPGSKPFYNSVVSTFALLAARGETPEQIENVMLELLPVRDLCAGILSCLEQPPQKMFLIPHTITLPLPELWERLGRRQIKDMLDDLLFEVREYFENADPRQTLSPTRADTMIKN